MYTSIFFKYRIFDSNLLQKYNDPESYSSSMSMEVVY